MSALTPAVSAWLSGQLGVAHRMDLLRLGLTAGPDRLAAPSSASWSPTRIACTGWLGHRRPPSRPWPWPQRSRLNVVVSFGAAARVWGMRRVGNDGLLHVTIAGRAHRSIPDMVVHRSHRIDAIDIVDRKDGIRADEPAAHRLRSLGEVVRRADPLDRRAGPPQRCLHHGDAGGDRQPAGPARSPWVGVLRAGAVRASPRAQADGLRPGAPPGACRSGWSSSARTPGRGTAARRSAHPS